VNLGTARIVVIVALVVAGAVVLANGFPDSGEAAAPLGTTTPTPTTSPSGSETSSPSQQPAQTPSPQAPGKVTFMALNGTEVTGAGAAAEQLLTQDGYVSAQTAADAPSKGVATTTIYYRGGQDAAQNKSDATQIADAYFNKADVKKLDTSLAGVVPDTAMIVVLVGQDYADSLVT
jgi:LytR cell envelope-related transcriptional attenuator